MNGFSHAVGVRVPCRASVHTQWGSPANMARTVALSDRGVVTLLVCPRRRSRPAGSIAVYTTIAGPFDGCNEGARLKRASLGHGTHDWPLGPVGHQHERLCRTAFCSTGIELARYRSGW
jgi:hypothetical protein